jgi:hypothetical protein
MEGEIVTELEVLFPNLPGGTADVPTRDSNELLS